MKKCTPCAFVPSPSPATRPRCANAQRALAGFPRDRPCPVASSACTHGLSARVERPCRRCDAGADRETCECHFRRVSRQGPCHPQTRRFAAGREPGGQKAGQRVCARIAALRRASARGGSDRCPRVSTSIGTRNATPRPGPRRFPAPRWAAGVQRSEAPLQHPAATPADEPASPQRLNEGYSAPASIQAPISSAPSSCTR